MKSLVFRIGKQVKILLNYLLDRIIDFCDFLITWSEIFPRTIHNSFDWVVYLIGHLAIFINNFPRIDVYQINGPDYTINFVGNRIGLLEIQDLFFYRQEFSTINLSRVLVWRLPIICKNWLSEGVDMVVCELSRSFPWKLTAAYSFTSPKWVTQLLDLPALPDDLLVGRRIHGPRRRIRQAEKNGFSYRFTKSEEDFKLFYHRMYLPFIENRHGEQALTASYKDQYIRWFKIGGLILITQHDQPVGGTLVLRTGKLCHGIEMGILDNDPKLREAGINAYILWSTVLWSHSRGAKRLSLGGSHSWCANGSFDFKAQWSARVVRRKKIIPSWYFLSNQLSDPLLERINQLGLISEIDGKFFLIFIPIEKPQNLEEKADMAASHGLDGVVVVQPSKNW